LKDKDKIEQLFYDKLGSFEVKVDPLLWSNVSSELASKPTALSTKGFTALTKTILFIGTACFVFLAVKYPFKKQSTDTGVKETKQIKKINPKENNQQNKKMNKVVLKEEIKPLKTPLPTSITSIEKPKEQEEIIKKEAVIFVDTISTKEPLRVVKEFVEEVVPPVEPQKLPIEPQKEIKKDYTIEALPNIFTPNNDGKNDLFMVKTTGLYDFNITVIDDKNNVVYQSKDVNFSWNGLDLYQNESKPGKYIYIITAIDRKGNRISKYSPLTIRR